MDTLAVLKALARLEDDFARQGALAESDFLQAVDKCRLGPNEAIGLRAELATRGIRIDSLPIAVSPATDTVEGSRPDRGAARSRRRDDLGSYLDEIGTVELLSSSEERSLGRCIQLGRAAAQQLSSGSADPDGALQQCVEQGTEARTHLIRANLRLVIGLAKRYARVSGVDLRDLIQEGNIGLMTAADKFDHSLGYRFSTYAMWWIRQSITRGIQERGRTIRLPVHIAEALTRIRRVRRLLAHEQGGSEPSVKQIAEQLQMPPEQVQFVLDSSSPQVLSLDGDDSDDEQPHSLGASLAATSCADPLMDLMQRDLAGALAQSLADFTPREREVIALRFGLGDGEAKTLEEVGNRFGITRERVRQIEAKVLHRLRHPVRARRLQDFLDDENRHDP